jgi:MFS transporter, NNP family, nitrate/nitrite transporter
MAGGSFAVGVAYVSRFYPAERQGTALGIFGVGNVGASVTKLLAPFVLIAWGWHTVALIWAAALAVMAIIFWYATEDDPVTRVRAGQDIVQPRSFLAEFAPLKDIRVWRFAFYYFFAFGAFVALSLWLPRYLIGVYGFEIATAGVIAALYSIPASIFRAYGGMLSDKHGARGVLYVMFLVATGVTLLLALPPSAAMLGTIATFGAAVGPVPFIALVFVLGFVMSLGKAAVYKHIPAYYPTKVGAVGGMVGMIGGLGGFVLPIVFGALYDLTGEWSSCFALLFCIAASGLGWMHLAIRKMERREISSELLAMAAE